MVARRFIVHHRDSNFDVDYDTNDGLEVLKFQLFSLTSIPPDQQKIFGGDDDKLVVGDSDLDSITDKLELISINDEEKSEVADFAKSDEELARMLQEEEDRLMLQQVVVSEENGVIEQRILPYIDQVLMYEDPHRQDIARKTVPVETLEEKAVIALAKEGNFKPLKTDQDHAFLLQLLFWFKTSFRWVHAPQCDGCGNETVNHGMGVAVPTETKFGASRVELYRCMNCSRITRFPRYNDPLKLLETRKGRCGEWANCFTLYCRAFGYESRLIMDFTDHVWTECFLPSLGRWMHLDPCEGIHDNPLLYEKGWKKNLSYVIAIARDGAYDVTKRYTRKWHEVLHRRNLASEHVLASFLIDMSKDCRKNFTSQNRAELEERDKKEADAIDKDYHSKDDSLVSLPGRLSGDKEWRALRSEIGSDGISSLTTSFCPVRKCIDEHVTKIYNAFHPLIVHMVDQSYSKSKTVEVLSSLRSILVNIKRSPFRERRTSMDLASSDAQHFVNQTLLHLGELFNALSLKTEAVASGKIDICLAAEPVKTALSLPVVFHALDDLIQNVKQCDEFNQQSLAWPLLKLNRLCSGLVLGSSEELPFGIVTSAFDGTRMTKWEEPNGARGCWIIYKVPENQFHELVAYELMSANDAPERDPMNWIVEGSNNGGSSWYTLDEQTNQIFVNRFERKTYKIAAQSVLSNTFRLRFLAVRDVQATSRLQIAIQVLYTCWRRSTGDSNGTPEIEKLMRHQYYRQKANEVAEGDNTILHLASLSGDLNCITYILKEFKHLLVRTNLRKETPLHLAARKGDFYATNALIDAAKELKLSSQDILQKCNVDLDTPLHLAVRSGDFLTANVIVLSDQSFRYGENRNKITPIYAAVEGNDPNIIHVMYKYCGKPLCVGGPDGRTALHAAIGTHNKEFVNYILKEQTSIVRVADDKGWTAFHYAAFHNWPDIISNLVQSMKEIEKDRGYLRNYRNGGIQIAIKEGNLSVLVELIKDMVITEEFLDERAGTTILHTAVEHNQRDIVEYILQNVTGEDLTSILNAQGYKDKNTALHLSVMHGNFFPDLINRIKVEDITLKNESNLTAYDLLYLHEEIQHDQLKIKDALEAIQSNQRWKLKFWQKNKLELSSEEGLKEKGKRSRKNIKFEEARKESMKEKVKSYGKRTNTQIIVAALITTVAFTVGFTMPGGLNQSGQVEQGYAVLSKKKAFAVFMAADAMALLFSTASLFLYFLSSLYENAHRISTHILISTVLNIFSIVAMMVTFMMGTVVVLAQSTLLTVFVYVVSSIFFLFVIIALLVYGYDRQQGKVKY